MRDDRHEGMDNGTRVPVMAISRLRMGTDGNGVTTLVAFHGCPLRCRYCLNPECWNREERCERFTPQELYERVKVDELYFRATGGGVTFGGGEPCLRADFIRDFRSLCGRDWKIRVETSLQVPPSTIKTLAGVVDEWIVDVKTHFASIYQEYTRGGQSMKVDDCLKELNDCCGVPREKVRIRVPVIPGYIDEEKAEKTVSYYKRRDYTRIERFTYVTDREAQKEEERLKRGNGKQMCKLLKDVRREVAERNGWTIMEKECRHRGECPGTCPHCEAEADVLMAHLKKRRTNDMRISEELDARLNNGPGMIDADQRITGLMGDVKPEERDFLLKECAVAGVFHYLVKDDTLWDDLYEGEEVKLVRQRHNKYDDNAVAVALTDDAVGEDAGVELCRILGYVPRDKNSEIAALMDAGYGDRLSALISTLNRDGGYANSLRISIYIKEVNQKRMRGARGNKQYRTMTRGKRTVKNIDKTKKPE